MRRDEDGVVHRLGGRIGARVILHEALMMLTIKSACKGIVSY